jgi:hypothetical protein
MSLVSITVRLVAHGFVLIQQVTLLLKLQLQVLDAVLKCNQPFFLTHNINIITVSHHMRGLLPWAPGIAG